MADVSTATPIAPPSWRTALNIVDARPVAAAVIVANPAAWSGTKMLPIASPRVTSRIRGHHRLVVGPRRPSRPIDTAVPRSPTITCLRGPSRGYSTRLASCAPAITPNASGKMDNPAPSADSPRPSWKYSETAYSAPEVAQALHRTDQRIAVGREGEGS